MKIELLANAIQKLKGDEYHKNKVVLAYELILKKDFNSLCQTLSSH